MLQSCKSVSFVSQKLPHPEKSYNLRISFNFLNIHLPHTKQSYEGSRRFIYILNTLFFDIRKSRDAS